MKGQGRAGRQFIRMLWSSYKQSSGAYDVEKKSDSTSDLKMEFWQGQNCSLLESHTSLLTIVSDSHTLLSHWWVTLSETALSRVPSRSLGRLAHLRRPFLSAYMAPQAMSQPTFCCVCFSMQKPPWSSFISSPEPWKLDQVCICWKLKLPHPKAGRRNLIPNQCHCLRMVSLPSTQNQVPVYFLSEKKKSYSWPGMEAYAFNPSIEG